MGGEEEGGGYVGGAEEGGGWPILAYCAPKSALLLKGNISFATGFFLKGWGIFPVKTLIHFVLSSCITQYTLSTIKNVGNLSPL